MTTEFKMVPVEPTEEMIEAASYEYGSDADVYRAMLAAAPVSPQPIYAEEKERELFEASNIRCVREADFDRVTAERDAALARVEELESDEPEWSAIQLKLGDANVDLQKRLTAADEREDAARAFVTRLIECAGDQPSIATGYLRDILDALKPAEGGGDEYRKSCEAAHKALSMENQRITPVRFKCLACGEYHEGSGTCRAQACRLTRGLSNEIPTPRLQLVPAGTGTTDLLR